MKSLNNIQQNLAEIKARLSTISAQPITLVAVSKMQSIDCIQQAIAAGQLTFGENYLQEALPKIKALPDNLQWHFIGPVQSNKTKDIARHFSWVQTVDRAKIAEKLHEHRPAQLPPLNVLIQVNINDEPTKSGIAPAHVAELARVITALPHLKLRGLMAIPDAHQSEQALRHTFQSMFQLYQSLQDSYDIDTLSLGMTHDYLLAVAAGSTMVRIGTGIFGQRGRTHE